MTDLWWTADGAGPSMLLLHGGLGLDHSYLRTGLQPLAEHFRLISFDQRGCGQSPAPADWSTAELDTWVQDVDAVREASGCTRALVFGHSFGGMLAIEYALRRPDRVSGMILSATYPVFDYAEEAVRRAVARATPEQQQSLLAGLTAPFADDAALAAFVATCGSLYFHVPRLDGACVLAAIRCRAAAMNRTLHHWLHSIDLTPRLSELRCPVLIASGTDDWIAPTSVAADRLDLGIPHADRVDFTRSGHFPFLEESDDYAAAVVTWARHHALLSPEVS